MELPYSEKKLAIEFPKSVSITICEPNYELSKNKSADKMLSDIFKSEEWRKFVHNDQSTQRTYLIIVNDATRSTPTKFVLDILLAQLKQSNIVIEFLIANGSHRDVKDRELEEIFGVSILAQNPVIYNHNYIDYDNMEYCGNSPTFNTEIWVNKLLFNEKYDKIITINSVEPHYFGGWTGGRKSIIPGCAGEKTITQTHKHALSAESKVGKLEGNPVHDDFMECLDIALKRIDKQTFSFQLIQDSKNNIAGIYGGTIFTSFEKCVKKAQDFFLIPVVGEFDFVILVVYPPLDKNFYQSHKAIENSRLVLTREIPILLVSPCREGIGPQKFLEPIQDIYNKDMPKGDFYNYINNNYKLGYHKAAKLVDVSKNHQIFLKSIHTELKSLKKVLTQVDNIQTLFDNLNHQFKPIKQVLVVLDAGIVVPKPL